MKIFPDSFMGWMIFIITILAYLILMKETTRRRGIKSQSFFTNLLWSILEVLIFITMFEEESSSLALIFGCVICSFLMSILLIKYDKEKKWTADETNTTILIVIVVSLWLYSGSNILGLTFAVVAEIIAGWPQMKRSWISPGTRLTLISYILFLFAYALSIINSPDWQLKNVFLPSAFFFYCVGDTFPLIMKWWKIERRYELIQKT